MFLPQNHHVFSIFSWWNQDLSGCEARIVDALERRDAAMTQQAEAVKQRLGDDNVVTRDGEMEGDHGDSPWKIDLPINSSIFPLISH